MRIRDEVSGRRAESQTTGTWIFIPDRAAAITGAPRELRLGDLPGASA
jgi:hypothetical protein